MTDICQNSGVKGSKRYKVLILLFWGYTSGAQGLLPVLCSWVIPGRVLGDDM